MKFLRFLCVIVVIYSVFRARRQNSAAATHQLGRWKYVLFAFAAIVTILAILNPEYLVLDLLGDAAFFDLFVLALTLQLHMLTTGAWQQIDRALCRGLRWLMMPSTAMGCLITLSVFAAAAAANTLRGTRPI